MAVLRAGAGQLVPECKRPSGSGDSVDTDCACSFRVLENHSDKCMGTEYRSSLAGIISPDTVVRWRVLSCALLRRPVAARLRKTCRLGRHHCCRPGSGCAWRDTHSICEEAFACLEHAWAYRHRFCCLQRATIWSERLAGDAPIAGTSTVCCQRFWCR